MSPRKMIPMSAGRRDTPSSIRKNSSSGSRQVKCASAIISQRLDIAEGGPFHGFIFGPAGRSKYYIILYHENAKKKVKVFDFWKKYVILIGLGTQVRPAKSVWKHPGRAV